VLTDTALRVFEAASDAIIVVDSDGVISLANPMAHTMFGYEPSELAGRPIEALVPESKSATHRAHRLRYRVDPRPRPMGDQSSRLAGRRLDGSTFPVDVALSPVEVEGQAMTLAVARDVSERVRAEIEHDAVRRSLDAVDDAVLMFDPATLQLTYVNRGAIAQLGYGRADLLGGMTPLHVLPEHTDQSFRRILEPVLSGRQPVIHLGTRVMRADGGETPVEMRLQYPDIGQDRRVVAISRDVSDRELAAERLRASEARVSLIEDRERIGRDLHDVVIQRLFATGMQLQAALTSPERLLERAQSTIADLDETIAAIRDTVFQLTTADIPLEREITLVVDRHRRASHNEIEAVIEGPIGEVDSEVGQHLVATLNELLSNVSRHAKADLALVTVSVGEHAGDDVHLTVTDDGVGMASAVHRGYGLSNVARRARELGGELDVRPGQDGRGLLVRWSVPRCPGAR
jgi:PAS domain S-box-containing protein